MGIGSGIFLIVIGAILAFAIAPDTWEVVNLNVVGYICIGAGILALILGLIYNQQRANTSHREVTEHYDDRRPPPAV
ncbi:DUF6458 family protein [Actinotalea sp. K2]|uniref:DUF6458 family protein n=1 Tax=Actinotalea sp. K2 TaxID=2939438 RepID=UPI0020179C45|nr:DUF6458 family protein [Actinotalea sp. K2]MCL3861666.1 DUF6458 family protein [Actinotalea sp. K2]